MINSHGIVVDSWVRVGRKCDITTETVGDETHFRFGDERATTLSVVLTEDGLENLANASAEALRGLRAGEHG
ncbi:hypothetical protein [Actinokineospora pegani]|uniref:hypothetical protein n=1 Tax=Actinokineospora pegani TaxID=2654637 RepID=UPI0012EAA67E|nr:hypothetical protein [Actinokineospora pegani]